MKRELFFALALSLAYSSAFAQATGRDTTPPTDADITPQSSAPGSGGSAGSGPGGSGDSNTQMGDSATTILKKKFKLLDTSGDDLISPEEAKGSESLSQSFTQADQNKDGLLTLDEYRLVVDTGVGSSGAGGDMQTSPPPSESGAPDNTGGSSTGSDK